MLSPLQSFYSPCVSGYSYESAVRTLSSPEFCRGPYERENTSLKNVHLFVLLSIGNVPNQASPSAI